MSEAMKGLRPEAMKGLRSEAMKGLRSEGTEGFGMASLLKHRMKHRASISSLV
tara:strand:+ start:54 stop:212 length:159 start_codon:yes stop_codon:yes gene_type:complete